jgi:peptidyl-tRNA hydrolase, PTH2 family
VIAQLGERQTEDLEARCSIHRHSTIFLQTRLAQVVCDRICMSSMQASISEEMVLMAPWLYFLAGSLLPTLAYFFWPFQTHGPRPIATDDDDENDDDSDGDLVGVTANGPSSSWGYRHAPYKMLLLVNQELKTMTKGKMAAQCCHAAVACYKRAAKQCPSALAAWERTGCAKICIKCPTLAEMEEIAAICAARDIPYYLVEDAGRTQIAAGSRTVLGMLGPVSVFEGVTDHLKLM